MVFILEFFYFICYNRSEVFIFVHVFLTGGVRKVSYIQRKGQILKILNEKDACSIHYLSKHLYVSPSTLRRDLISMEDEGIIKRHHGGIVLSGGSSSEESVNRRRMVNQEKKAKIARFALGYVREGMVLFLDSSSTISHLCPLLKQFQNLTVVTNGLLVAQVLSTSPGIKCYLCPGLIKPRSSSIVGEYSADFLRNFHADLLFFSCKAINSRGLFEGDDQQAMMKRNMFPYAAERILLCDNTKEDARGYFRLSEFDTLSRIITNGGFSAPLSNAIRSSSCALQEV